MQLSLAGTVGLNPAGVWIFVSFECCVLSRADPTCRGVFPIVVCHCELSGECRNEMALAVLACGRKKTNCGTGTYTPVYIRFPENRASVLEHVIHVIYDF